MLGGRETHIRSTPGAPIRGRKVWRTGDDPSLHAEELSEALQNFRPGSAAPGGRGHHRGHHREHQREQLYLSKYLALIYDGSQVYGPN